MKVVIKNCDEFYNTFKFLETLNDQIKIICTEENIWLQVPSSSHTALADVKFPASYFESYECNRPVTIGVYCKVFLKILKNTYKKKGVTLMIEGQDGKDTIVVTITQESEEDGKYVSSYILKMVEIVSDMMNIPVQDVHSRFKLTKATLKKWKDLLYDDAPVTFTPGKDGIFIECTDDNRNKVKLLDGIKPSHWENNTKGINDDGDEFERKKWNTFTVGGNNMKLVYSLLNVGTDIRIQFFIEEAPVECYAKFQNGVYVRLYIAPKINDDELEEDEVEEAPVRTNKRKTMDESPEPSAPQAKQKKVVAAH